MNFTVSQEALSALAASLLKHENSNQYDSKELLLKKSHEILITSSEVQQHEYNENSFKETSPEKEIHFLEVEHHKSSENLLNEIPHKREISSLKSGTINENESNETEIHLKALLLRKNDQALAVKKKVSNANNTITSTCINMESVSAIEIDIKEEGCLLPKITQFESLKPNSKEYFSKRYRFNNSFEDMTSTSNQLDKKEEIMDENKIHQTLSKDYGRLELSAEFTNLAKNHKEENLRLYIQRIIDTSRQMVLNNTSKEYAYLISGRPITRNLLIISGKENNSKVVHGKLNHSQTKTNQEIKKLIVNQLSNNEKNSLFYDNFSNAKNRGVESATKKSSQKEKYKKKGSNIKSFLSSLFGKRRIQ